MLRTSITAAAAALALAAAGGASAEDVAYDVNGESFAG